MMEKVINYTENGKCSNCGQCCTDYIPISQKEINRIRKYIKKHRIEDYPLIENGEIYCICPFRNRKKKICMIYEVRPDICRKFICSQSMDEMMKNKKEAFDKARYNNDVSDYRSLRSIFYNDDTLDKATLTDVINKLRREKR